MKRKIATLAKTIQREIDAGTVWQRDDPWLGKLAAALIGAGWCERESAFHDGQVDIPAD
jgi:hypothetical protein